MLRNASLAKNVWTQSMFARPGCKHRVEVAFQVDGACCRICAVGRVSSSLRYTLQEVPSVPPVYAAGLCPAPFGKCWQMKHTASCAESTGHSMGFIPGQKTVHVSLSCWTDLDCSVWTVQGGKQRKNERTLKRGAGLSYWALRTIG
jgi:hypothetical protein